MIKCNVYSQQFVEELKQLYESGITLSEIAKKFNADKHTISKYLKKIGVEIPRNKAKEIVGNKYGMITILSFDKDKNGYHCKCDCGNYYFMKFRDRSYYINGRNKSCGCYSANRTHGMSYKSPLYNVWKCIKARCYNKNNKRYKNYGGRGIVLCDNWQNYTNFHDWAINNGYQQGLTIDRIDNNGNYCPENCRWVNAIIQMNNQSRNHKVTYNGETHTLAEWGRLQTIPASILCKRLYSGWEIDRAFTQPVRKRW